MNYRLDIEYDGAPFCGWQVQPNGKTIQGELERSLKILLKQPIRLQGAGRTDAGVHAENQVANFKFDGSIPAPGKFLIQLNALAGPAIAVHRLTPVADNFHARFSARWRKYRYQFCTHKQAIHRNTSHFLHWPINWHKVNRLLPLFKGEHDFINFSVDPGEKSTLCRVRELKIEKAGNQYYFTISANRFLHKMVRMLAGTLIDVGRGKLSAREVRAALALNSPKKVSTTFPAKALFLTKIGY